MCKVIAIANQKGGVAKSVTTAQLGAALSNRGKKVLIIDADSQGSITKNLGYRNVAEFEVTLSDIFSKLIREEDIELDKGILLHDEGMYMLPSTSELANTEISLATAMDRERILKEYIDMQREHFDYAMLHDPDRIKDNPDLQQPGNKEVEAESIAYIVCQHFGIDTSDYSFGYIAGWSEGREMEDLKSSMNTIRETSAEMINRIEGNLRAIDRDRNMANEDVEKTEDLSNVKEAKALVDAEKKPEESVKNETKKEPEEKKEPVKAAEKKKEPREPERKSIRSKLASKQKEVDKRKTEKTKSKDKSQEI